MALDFPASPTDGQTYQGYTYSSSIGAWQAKPAAQSPFFTGATPPANPVAGDSWFNTNDGTMYVYYYDGNTYQWVEHRSQIAKNQVGLTPIIPTSVTVGSGTGTTASDGETSFSGASTISLNGVFSASFRNYKVLVNITSATGYSGQSLGYRLRTTSDLTTSAYYFGAHYAFANPSLNGVLTSSDSGSSFGKLAWLNNGQIYGGVSMDITNPYVATSKTLYFHGAGAHPQGSIYNYGSGIVYAAQSYSGISFLSDGTGTMTGTVKIYGYN